VTVKPVVKLGELVLAAIKHDDLDELERLLDEAHEKKQRRVHGTKGMRYLRRRRKEVALHAAIDAKGPVDALRDAIAGAAEAGVPKSLIEQAEALLAKLIAVAAMEAADKEDNWKQLTRRSPPP